MVPFDRTYLDHSWDWLRDAETKALTMTPEFTREQQLAFFDTLPGRSDYHIWGVALADGTPIGAGGIKQVRGATGEFWCYIGEKSCWGRGLGPQILRLCEEQASSLGLDRLTMIAAEDNERSIRAFEKMGFERDGKTVGAGKVQLLKHLLP